MITINGHNFEYWGLDDAKDGIYSPIMIKPAIKSRTNNDYSNKDGLEVFLTPGKKDSLEVTLSLYCDTYEHYVTFMRYLVDQKAVNVFNDITNETLYLEYRSTSSFNWHPTFIEFSIKLRTIYI